MQKHRNKSHRLTQFSISNVLIAVTICSLIFYFASNWEPLINRLKYGRPVDIKTISISGLGEGLILQIGTDKVVTEKNRRIDRVMSRALGSYKDLNDVGIDCVWKNRSKPGEYTILVDDRYFKTHFHKPDIPIANDAGQQ